MKGNDIAPNTVLESGIVVLEKTKKKIARGKDKNVFAPVYKMCCTCGEIFEHTYKKDLKTCGNKEKHVSKKRKIKTPMIDHSGEILPSGIRIIEKTGDEREYGKDNSKFPVYRQWCPYCESAFEAVYLKKRKSCGCFDGKDRTGEVLPSGIKLIKRLNKQNKRGSYFYIQKCGVCGKEFEGVYNSKLKSCGCIALEKDRSGETNPYGVKIIKKIGEAQKKKDVHNQNLFVYKMECPECGRTFENRYNQNLKSCGCLAEKMCNTIERKSLLRKVSKNGREKNMRFGTNLGLIASNRIPKTNTSGYKGVYFENKSGKWCASMCFQGYTNRKKCNSKEEAIEERQNMEKERDVFLKWYDSLSEDEKEFFSEQYNNNKKEFSKFYKEKLREILGD